MAFDQDNIDFYLKNTAETQIDSIQLKFNQFDKRLTILQLVIKTPIYLLLILGIELSGLLFPGSKNRRIHWFLRYFFSQYFHFRGIDFYAPHPIPPTLNKPSVFLTNRINMFQAIFIFAMSKTPLIIPLDPIIYSFKWIPLFPASLINRWLKRFSYPDTPFPAKQDLIHQLLNKQYSIVAYMNESYCSPKESPKINIYGAIQTLIKPDINCYLVHLGGWDRYSFSTVFEPIMICVKSRLLYKVTHSKPVGELYWGLIAHYFQFRLINVLRP